MFAMLKRLIINFALKILKMEVVDRIEYAPVKSISNLDHLNLTRVAEIVTDANPDNKGQLAELWQAEKKNVAISAIETARNVIKEEVDDQRVVQYITAFLDELETEIRNGNILKFPATVRA